MSDTELIDYIEASPNPRLHLVVDAWLKCKGGLSLRDSMKWVMKNYPDIGFEHETKK